MKFWKILSSLIEETLPDWQDKFLSYKDLKKQLKLIYPKRDLSIDIDGTTNHENDGGRPSKWLRLEDDEMGQRKEDASVMDDGDCEVTKEVTDFLELLEKEIDKFNAFVENQEEEYIIILKVLQENVEEAKSLNGNLMSVGRQIVDFHGEMVLLENYSALNYIGLVKILKKYDKRSGSITRLPFIQKVLQQPFFRTDILNKLVKECETMLEYLFSLNELSSAQSEATEANEGSDTKAASDTKESSLKVPEDLAEIEYMESIYLKLASSALRVLKKIRSESSTVSMFSLPPMQTNELGEVWKKTSVVEQAAK